MTKKQRNPIRILFMLAISMVLGACASTPPVPTKWNDKNMRVMVDPDSIDREIYIRIVSALVKSKRWTVIDRGYGFRALKKEQERLHNDSEGRRYHDAEKWAHWGKLYGVGAVVVGSAECYHVLYLGSRLKKCTQFLHLIDATTGEILAIGEDVAEAEFHMVNPSWDSTVGKLQESYYENFIARQENSSKLMLYRNLSAAHAHKVRMERERRRKLAREKERQNRAEDLMEVLEHERMVEEHRRKRRK